jgi:hypothetical protein
MRHDQCVFCGVVKKDGIVKDGNFFCGGDHYDRYMVRHERERAEKDFDWLEGWVFDSIFREGNIDSLREGQFILLLVGDEGSDYIDIFTYDTKAELVEGMQRWGGNHGEGDKHIEGVYDSYAETKRLSYTSKVEITFEGSLDEERKKEYRDSQNESIRKTLDNHIETLRGKSGLADSTIDNLKKLNNERK